jgi:hypothetical protein
MLGCGAARHAAPERSASKPRETWKIKDIKMIPYGENGICTEPTVKGIFDAIEENALESRHFHNRDALIEEWLAKSGGKVLEWANSAREYHNRRVAYFVVKGWTDPIGVTAEGVIHDGSHRLRAAIFMRKEEVEVEIG